MRRLIIVLAVLSVPAAALAWGNKSAHPAINGQAFDLFLARFGQTEQAAGGRVRLDVDGVFVGTGVTDGGWFEVSTSSGPMALTLGGWLRHGGFSADEPEVFQSLRHFYDPFLAAGVAYLTDAFPNSGANPQINAKSWALDNPGNAWSWEQGKQAWRAGFEGSAEDRQAAFAKAFRCMGETLHLVADMVQAAHVRNDAHPAFEPVEDTLTGADVEALAGGPVDPRVTYEGLTVYEVFDALAKFTNEHFYSHETIYNADSPQVMPANGEAPNAHPQFSELEWDDLTRIFSATFGAQHASLVQERYSSWFARNHGYPNDAATFMVPAAFTQSQAAVLIPIAANANAYVLTRFFPLLELKIEQQAALAENPTAVRIGGRMVHKVDEDINWSDKLLYSGPGRLMKRAGGGEGEPMAVVEFSGGEITTPVDLMPSDLPAGAVLYLEVEVGGLIVESADLMPTARTGACGDGYCDYVGGENADACPLDCGYCGDDFCAAPKETPDNCKLDCGTCGDGECTAGKETWEDCALDCGYCGDSVCSPPRESLADCPEDCFVCGDGQCTAGPETEGSCPQDCAVCGDGYCTSGYEAPSTCAQDCGTCGNGTCEPEQGECKLEEVYGLACVEDCCSGGKMLCPDGSDLWCDEV